MQSRPCRMCYYSVGKKTMKWWRTVFWRMHGQAITNAFVIYNANRTDMRPVHQKQFRMDLAYAFTSPMMALRQFSRPPDQKLSCLTGKHFPLGLMYGGDAWCVHIKSQLHCLCTYVYNSIRYLYNCVYI